MKLFKKNNKIKRKISEGKGVKALNESIRKSIETKGLVPVTETKKHKGGTDKLKEALENAILNEATLMTETVKPMKTIAKPKSKFKLKTEKFKLKVKNSWEITKEFGRVIKCWAIVEYKIIRKLSYALSRKKEEVKIRKVFESNMTNFVNLYGYDIGMQRYHRLVKSIQFGIHMEKRLGKIGR